MSINKFVFKIERDSEGNAVDLYSMSIETTQSFLKIVDSIVKLANEYKANDESNDIKINIFRSSAAVSLEFDEETIFDEFQNDLQNVSTNQLEDIFKVKKFRNLQDSILRENYRMVAYLEKNNVTTNTLEIFRGTRFKIPTNQNILRLPINKFEKVYLNKIGGDIASAEIVFNKDTDNVRKENIKVKDLDLALGLTGLLYRDVYLLISIENKYKFEITDIYNDQIQMDSYIDWFENIQSLDGVQRYRAFTERIRNELGAVSEKSEKIDLLFKHSILFLHKKIESGMIRTILMTLKPFKSDFKINELFDEFINLYEKSTKRKID